MPALNGALVKHQYSFAVDITRFICALLVIIIHTSPFLEQSEILHFYTANVIARIAVPLFFAISGYYFFGSLVYSDGKIRKCKENQIKLLRYIKKIVHLYFGWSLVYYIIQIPMWYRTGWWGKKLIKDIVVNTLFSGSFYHLWYLLALIYAVPLLYIGMSYFTRKIQLYFFAGLWAFECLIYSYSWLGINDITVLKWLTDHFPVFFDAVFRTIPLLGVGILCLDCSSSIGNRQKMFGFMGLCVTEASALFFFSPNRTNYSYLIFTPVMTFYTLRVILTICGEKNRRMGYFLRKSSLIIYCFHPLVLYVLQNAGTGISRWLIVTIVSVTVALSCIYIQDQASTHRNGEKNES